MLDRAHTHIHKLGNLQVCRLSWLTRSKRNARLQMKTYTHSERLISVFKYEVDCNLNPQVNNVKVNELTNK